MMRPLPSRLAVIFMVLLFMKTQVAGETKPPALSAPPPKTPPVHLNSYLPAVMQVLAHLTNQMKYEKEASDTPITTTEKAASTTTTTQASTTKTTTQASADETTPFHAPANFAPLVPGPPKSNILAGVLTDPEPEELIPPIASPNIYQSTLLQPEYDAINPNVPYIKPHYPQIEENSDKDLYEHHSFPAFMIPVRGLYEPKQEEKPLFLPGNFAQNPNVFGVHDLFSKGRAGDDINEYVPAGAYPNLGSLPVENENNFKINPLENNADELTEENLQYLAPSVREILEVFHGEKNVPAEAKNNPTAFYQSIEDLYDNPSDKKAVGDWLRARKAAVTQTYIQLLLLYDLLSRDAKTQKLNNYHGYTPDIQKDLDDASLGTAGEQLKTVLERMVARGDCKYDFANNRAKELVTELGKPESKTSMEVRYLKPLRFS